MSKFPQYQVRRMGMPFPRIEDYLKDEHSLWNRVCEINGVGEQFIETIGARRGDNPLEGIPWLTPVLGSGCGFVYAPALRQQVCAQIEKILNEDTYWAKQQLPGGIYAPEFAARHGLGLVEGRTGSNVPASEQEDTESLVTVTPIAAQVTLLAALASGLVHEIARFVGNQPLVMNRGGTDGQRLSTEFTAISEQYALPMQRLIGEISQEMPQNGELKRFHLMEEVTSKIAKGLTEDLITVDQEQAKALSRIAWLYLRDSINGDGETAYPGWRDLLQSLSVTASGAVAGRPAFEQISKGGPGVRREFRKSTNRRVSEVSRDRSAVGPLFRTIADMLQAQTRLKVSSAPNGDDELPRPTAFLTRFDLELEMALATSDDSRPFLVAIPVHLVASGTGGTSDAFPMWLARVIRPSDARSDETDPAVYLMETLGVQPPGSARLGEERDWFLLTEDVLVDVGISQIPNGLIDDIARRMVESITEENTLREAVASAVTHVFGTDDGPKIFSRIDPRALESAFSMMLLVTRAGAAVEEYESSQGKLDGQEKLNWYEEEKSRLERSVQRDSDGLAELFSLAVDEAFAIADARTLAKAKLMPVVVHLTGSPLMRLPIVNQDGELWKEILQVYKNIEHAEKEDWSSKDSYPHLEFRHAVLLGEYDSVRQNALELYKGPEGRRYGLPTDLASWDKTPRFWLSLGVQLSDTAVRQRLITQILAPISLLDSKQGVLEEGWRTGLVVNTRIGDTDRDLLYWSGFDVVIGSAESMIAALEIYVQRLRDAEREITYGE